MNCGLFEIMSVWCCALRRLEWRMWWCVVLLLRVGGMQVFCFGDV